MSDKDVLKETRPRMETVIEDFKRKLATVRTGRAAVSFAGYGPGRLLRHPDAAQPDGFGSRSRTTNAYRATMGSVADWRQSKKQFVLLISVSTLPTMASSCAFQFHRLPKSDANNWRNKFTISPKIIEQRFETCAATAMKAEEDAQGQTDLRRC